MIVFLIDTSIWIDYFRGNSNKATTQFEEILDKKLPFGITSIIYQEILQGANSLTDFNKLKDYLITQRFFHPRNEIASYESAALIFYDCRKKGVTIRSTIDCLIAQIALEHELTLVHNDNDFKRIQSVVSALMLA